MKRSPFAAPQALPGREEAATVGGSGGWLGGESEPGYVSARVLRRVAGAFGLSVLALLTVGFVMLASTSTAHPLASDAFYYAKRQAMWVGLGLGACVVTTFIDYRQYRKYAWPLFVIAVVALVGVLFFGRRINGALRWYVVGPFRFQPSELAKFVVVIVLAFWLEKMLRGRKGQTRPRIQHWWWGVFAPLTIAVVPAVLILREPDMGTALLLGAATLVILWLAGAPSGWLASIAGAAGAGLAAVIVAIFKYGMFHEHYQVQRLLHWWYWDDLNGSNYQQHMAMQALGSGGGLGRGLGNSRVKLGFLPEAHTDFILPIVGEELGLIATLAITAAFCLLVVSGMVMASQSRDPFGRLLGGGIITIIGLQAFINIAVVTAMLPNKGMPLPFISYGGSTLVITLAAVGVLFSIFRQAHAEAERGVPALR